MTDNSKRKQPPQPPGSAKSTGDQKSPQSPRKPARSGLPQELEEDSLIKRITSIPGAMADSAIRMVSKTTDVPLRIGKALFLKPEQTEMIKEAGNTLKDLREVAGLTRDDLGEALDLKDHSLIEAVENGTAILSFELVLRLAALLARHDPVPVILKFTRSYNPDLWKLLEDWGLGRLSLHLERERRFINIYRHHDAARQLSNEGFEKVLEFTCAAFEMALHFIAEQEHLKDRILSDAELEEEQF